MILTDEASEQRFITECGKATGDISGTTRESLTGMDFSDGNGSV